MVYLVSLLILQVGDVAFSVPDSLVVTLERVLGNETIGKVQFLVLGHLFFLVFNFGSDIFVLLGFEVF